MMRKLFYILFLLLSTVSMSAQSNVALDANMHVVFETAGQKEYRTVQYALFKTATKAESVMQRHSVETTVLWSWMPGQRL